MKLRFEIDGTTLVLSCVVTRCRLQRSIARPGTATYSSGLRFTAAAEPSRAQVQSIVSSMIGTVQREIGEGSLPSTGV